MIKTVLLLLRGSIFALLLVDISRTYAEIANV
jgi:hypothetical protein